MAFTAQGQGADSIEAALPHAKAELISEYDSFVPSESFYVGVRIDLEKGWHTYWANPGDSGAPAKIRVRVPEHTAIGPILWPTPERILTGPITTFGYENSVLFAWELKIAADKLHEEKFPIDIQGEVLVCKEICIPARFSLRTHFPVTRLIQAKKSGNASQFAELRKILPAEEPGLRTQVLRENGQVRITLKAPERLKRAKLIEFFPYSEAGIEAKRSRITRMGGNWVLQAEASSVAKSGEGLGVALFETSQGTEAVMLGETAISGTERDGSSDATNRFPGVLGFLTSLFFAFLGGAMLNLMPCVFPVLFMKVYGILKQGAEKEQESRIENLFYSAGVLITFLLFAGLLVLLREAGAAVGWGFQLQSPFVVLALSILFSILALGFYGVFHFDFIDAGIGQGLVSKGGRIGAFFAGMLSVIVASPCTAPFMGASIGYAMTMPLPILFSVFLALGTGLALPTLALAISPSLLRFLPKPGAWMDVLKRVLTLPMIATVGWLLWLLSRISTEQAAVHSGIAILIGVIASVLIARSTPSRNIQRTSTALVWILVIAWAGVKVAVKGEPTSNSSATVEKSGILWSAYSPERAAKLRKEGKWVFVDFTADWCITCKVNERVTFHDKEVQAILKDRGIVTLLADWTKRDPVITRALTERGRIGVPFYLLLAPGENGAETALPEILTPGIFKNAIAAAMGETKGMEK